MSKIDQTLLDAALAAAPRYVAEWTSVALCTDAYTDRDLDEIPRRVAALYTGCGLTAPEHVAIARGPLSGGVLAALGQLCCGPRSRSLDAQIAHVAAKAGVHELLAALCAALRLPAPQAGGARDDAARSAVSDAIARISDARDPGSEWAWAPCYIEHARRELHLALDYSRWDLYLALARYGWRYELQRFAVVCERAELVRTDDASRLHSAVGPAKRWRDGHEVYSWHGQVVPASWIRDPGALRPGDVLRIANTEQRRAACEILGWERIARELPQRVIDADPDPEVGTLIEVDFPDSPRQKMLRVQCGTGRTFLLIAPSESTSARHAQALKYGTPDYRPRIRT